MAPFAPMTQDFTITADDYIAAYSTARGVVPVTSMGRFERAGYWVLQSVAKTEDGEPCARIALQMALFAGEVDAALEIHEGLLRDSEPCAPSSTLKSIAGEMQL